MTFGFRMAAKVMNGTYQGYNWVITAFRYMRYQARPDEKVKYADWLEANGYEDLAEQLR